MAKIKTRVTLRTPQAAALIKAASNEALTDMGLQALQDASKHVPHDQGDLEGSGLDNSDKKATGGKYTMRWHTSYAQYLWNGDVMYGNPTERRYGPKRFPSHRHSLMKNGRNMQERYTVNSGSKCIRRR